MASLSSLPEATELFPDDWTYAVTAAGSRKTKVSNLQNAADVFTPLGSPYVITKAEALEDQFNILRYVPQDKKAAIKDFTSTWDAHEALMLAFASVSLDTNGAKNASAPIYHPYGKLFLEQPLDLKTRVLLKGSGSGFASVAQPSVIQCAANIGYAALVINRDNTSLGAKVTSGGSADGTVIEGIAFRSLGGTAGHGCRIRARAMIRDCVFSDFPENGVYWLSTLGSGIDENEGNANGTVLDHLLLSGNGLAGISVNGADTNAGQITRCDFRSNGTWGLNLSAFLSNGVDNCQFASNGVRGIVNYGGLTYYTIDASLAGTTTPGTNSNVWVESSGLSLSSSSAWVSGATYLRGGPYFADDANARTGFFNNYVEPDQAPPCLLESSFSLGGHHPGGMSHDTTGVWLKDGRFYNLKRIQVKSLPVYADNAAATTGGLAVGDFYRTSTGVAMVRY